VRKEEKKSKTTKAVADHVVLGDWLVNYFRRLLRLKNSPSPSFPKDWGVQPVVDAELIKGMRLNGAVRNKERVIPKYKKYLGKCEKKLQKQELLKTLDEFTRFLNADKTITVLILTAAIVAKFGSAQVPKPPNKPILINMVAHLFDKHTFIDCLTIFDITPSTAQDVINKIKDLENDEGDEIDNNNMDHL
jgi:hypothetical protein